MASHLSLDLARLQAALVHWVSHEAQRGLFVTDSHFRVIVWNQWMEIHSGRSSADVAGRSLFELYPDTIERGIREYYESALDGAVTVVSHGLHRFLVTLPPTNTDLVFGEMPQSGYIGPLNDGGGVIGTVTVIEDVSEQLAAEIALRKQIEAQRRARATAEEALHAKDEFLSTLSHEMRTPLNAVLGWARILLDRKLLEPALVQRALQVIERNATAQAKMIDDMLDMARIVSGKMRLEMKPVDLVTVVLSAVDVIMPTADAKKLTVRTNLDPETPMVLGDVDRLQQVLVNLLSNAVKFTGTGGSIDVTLDTHSSFVRVVVADTGHGISSDFLPHVFERFRQSDASSTRRHGGLGLGLGLVRDLIELHGGSVRAESDGEGQGATFTVHVPVVTTPAAMRSARSGDIRQGATTLASVRVLLIEDESDARDLVWAALARCGAQVSAVSSSSEAMSAILDAAPESRPHVIVSDIAMPVEDGYSFIEALRRRSPEQGGLIPAVTLTGYAAPHDVDRALAAGYQVHLPKPMDPAALVDAVARLSRDSSPR
jgi:signal transduction histidine kinase/CheY-like chemotaxis protein